MPPQGTAMTSGKFHGFTYTVYSYEGLMYIHLDDQGYKFCQDHGFELSIINDIGKKDPVQVLERLWKSKAVQLVEQPKKTIGYVPKLNEEFSVLAPIPNDKWTVVKCYDRDTDFLRAIRPKTVIAKSTLPRREGSALCFYAETNKVHAVLFQDGKWLHICMKLDPI